MDFSDPAKVTDYESQLVSLVEKQPYQASELSKTDKDHLRYLKEQANAPVAVQIQFEQIESDVADIEADYERMQREKVFDRPLSKQETRDLQILDLKNQAPEEPSELELLERKDARVKAEMSKNFEQRLKMETKQKVE